MESRLVAVDFDGTLATLEVDWSGVRRRLEEETERCGGSWDGAVGLDENLRRLRQECGEALFIRLCRITTAFELEGFRRNTAVNSDLVDRLRARGDAALAVVSANTRETVESALCSRPFRSLRPFIVAKEDVGEGKPHPEGLWKACDHFGVRPADAVMIGDGESDHQAAVRAGFGAFILVREGRFDGVFTT